MKERIKELAEHVYGTQATAQEIKFAELIINECLNKCEEVQTMYGQYTFTATKCKEAIKGHFGVEE